MSVFTKSNTVEQMILDATAKPSGKPASMVRENAPPYRGKSLGNEQRPARWAIRAKVVGSTEPMTQQWL